MRKRIKEIKPLKIVTTQKELNNHKFYVDKWSKFVFKAEGGNPDVIKKWDCTFIDDNKDNKGLSFKDQK